MSVDYVFPWGHKAHFPLISVRLGHQAKWITPVRGLIDSGAICTLAHASMAEALGLGDITKPPSGRSMSVGGAGGRPFKAYEWELDLELTNTVGAIVAQQRTITMIGVKVYFTKADLIKPILLGQHDLLERLFFYQLNYPAEPQFVLHDELTKPRQRQFS